ncbi:ArsR/SmtB family transcription factor [Mycobacterium aquaticum]|uniref:Transcriptional regulator n=1 Tax=Mycobacterium aquaticum TaxID=1927124 RepID=A0A1X0A7I2_9MYCO|nr:metalloregulator ArsR/SmtB family transcription factor [Mycobacterium aquaticum]ORA26037.1 transcriptional regulator [Mycobacterium aquaticum]
MCADTKVCTFGPDSAYVDLAAEVLRLVSDPTRIRIILALRDHGELSVNQLAELVGKTPTTTSQHLAKLRWGRVVGARQDGARMFYQLVDEQARELVALAVFQAERALGQGSAHERAGLPPGPAGLADGRCPGAGRSTSDDGADGREDES